MSKEGKESGCGITGCRGGSFDDTEMGRDKTGRRNPKVPRIPIPKTCLFCAGLLAVVGTVLGDK